MSTIDGTFFHDGVTVKYKYRKAVGDRRNLTVIFSGFRNRGTYDFDGAPVAGIRGNILWILDDFSGDFAYYLCSNMDFRIENAVAALVDEAIRYLDISRDRCTVAGFSKGGSAALYYGIKYNYGAVVATVPQFHIGSYVKRYWPAVFESMTKVGSSVECEYLDSLLPALVRRDPNLTRSIYLFSSESDPQHKTEIEPYLEELRKYSNFNYVLTDSPLVDTHSAVTRYNVPTITSIMSLLAEGAKPILGELLNGSLAPGNSASQLTLDPVREREEVVHAFTSLSLQGSVFFPEGYAFEKGHSAGDYGSVRTHIQLSNSSFKRIVRVGGVKDPLLSTRFYENQFCDYSVAKFASLAHKGIPMEDFPDGKYDIYLHIRHANKQRVLAGRSERAFRTWSADKGSLYKIEASESKISLTKRPALGTTARAAYFDETGRWAAESRVHFEGYFAVQGIPAPNYPDVRYYLVLCSVEDGAPIGTFPLASDHRPELNEKFDDPWIDYSKGYYATPKYSGIEIPGIEPGKYLAFITGRFGDTIFSEQLKSVVTVASSFASLVPVGEKPIVHVVGSGVSLDNFDDRLSPGWQSYFTLGNESYQSAFLSLMSNSMEVPSEKLGVRDQLSTHETARNAGKAYLSELTSDDAPDVLVIDFFAEARLGRLCACGPVVIDGALELREENYWEASSEQQIPSPLDEMEYIDVFRLAVEEFNRLREMHFPATRVVLNSARAVESYFDNGARIKFPKNSIDDINTIWAKLDEIFLQCVPAEVVRAVTDNTISDPGHPGGPGPHRYEAGYYELFREQLLRLLDYEMAVSLD